MTDQAFLFIELDFFNFVALLIKRGNRSGFGFNEQNIHIATHILPGHAVDLIPPLGVEVDLHLRQAVLIEC